MSGLPARAATLTVTALTPNVANPGWGEAKQDWTNPTTVATVKGARYPADAKAEERLKQQGITITDTFYLEPISWQDSNGTAQGLKPAQNRLACNGVQYVVREVRDWDDFLEVQAEQVRAT